MYKNIYIMVSDFIQAVEAYTKLCSLCYNWNGRREPKRRLSITQVITLNIMRFLLHIKNLKAFHRTIKMLDLVPGLPNYENFLKASNKALPVLTLFLLALLVQNRELNDSDVHFMDSPPGLYLPEQTYFQPQGHEMSLGERKVHLCRHSKEHEPSYVIWRIEYPAETEHHREHLGNFEAEFLP